MDLVEIAAERLFQLGRERALTKGVGGDGGGAFGLAVLEMALAQGAEQGGAKGRGFGARTGKGGESVDQQRRGIGEGELVHEGAGAVEPILPGRQVAGVGPAARTEQPLKDAHRGRPLTEDSSKVSIARASRQERFLLMASAPPCPPAFRLRAACSPPGSDAPPPPRRGGTPCRSADCSFPSASQRLMSSAQRRCSVGVALNMAKPNSDSPLT